jgi:hypothetical protein
LRRGIGAAAAQARLQEGHRGGRQKDRDQRLPQIGVRRRAGADRGGALNVDVEQNVLSPAQRVEHLGLGCAVAEAMHLRVLQEIPGLHAL